MAFEYKKYQFQRQIQDKFLIELLYKVKKSFPYYKKNNRKIFLIIAYPLKKGSWFGCEN